MLKAGLIIYGSPSGKGVPSFSETTAPEIHSGQLHLGYYLPCLSQKGCLISSTPISPASLLATVSLALSLALLKLANRLQTRLTKEVSEEQTSGEFQTVPEQSRIAPQLSTLLPPG